MEALACNMCKEPAAAFVCMDCMAQDIQDMIPARLEKGFRKFHNSLISHFSGSGEVHCAKCGSAGEEPICPSCYTGEASRWLEDKDGRLAKRLTRVLDVVEEELPREEDVGICDECGEYTEDLVSTHGEWLCRDCAVYEEE
ncbi:MAG: hypothetical protein HY369_00230 [Candidatus Aenigmarchaeota archaeon]|nr:hypothetical protein [Candidatus Aenigmarchaeota archaeon]